MVTRTSRPLNTRRQSVRRAAPAQAKSEPEPVPTPDPSPATPGPAVEPGTPRRVVIDGIEYRPAPTPGTTVTTGSIVIAITTHDRNDLLAEALRHHQAHLPPNARLIVVDDASAKPVDGADYRFEDNVGVARAKNKCLELAMRTGAEHLFLFDDDTWPISDDWWKPYLDSPEPHLAHSWNLQKIFADDRHTAWHASGGTVLYYTREVIADVGGMRTDFGTWGCEHVNLSDRIHNRGWTSWRYADITGAERLFYECDRERARNGHKSTATPEQRQHNAGPGRELWISRIHTDDEFVEYRQLDDVILTCLFTNKQAQLSGRRLRPTVEPLRALADSVKHGRMVCFYDRMENPELATGTGESVEFVPAECKINIFFQRWLTYWQWLRQHPEVGRVWCVDGTDVTMLRDPFEPLEPGKLHIGWEPVTQESKWLRDHHPEKRVQEFMINNPGLQLVNPGLVGGDRATVLEFCHAMTRYFFDVAIDHAQVWQPRPQAIVGSGDVPAANLVAYTRFGDRLITGTRVATVFKAFEASPQFSLWQHK